MPSEKKQLSLDEFMNSYRCPICGREFDTDKGLKLHMSRVHPPENEDMMPGEYIEVHSRGDFVELRVIMKRTLWRDICRKAQMENARVDHMLFKCLTNLATFGTEFEYWTPKHRPPEELPYIR